MTKLELEEFTAEYEREEILSMLHADPDYRASIEQARASGCMLRHGELCHRVFEDVLWWQAARRAAGIAPWSGRLFQGPRGESRDSI